MREASTRATHLDDREALAQRLPALLNDLLVNARLAIVRVDRGRGDLGGDVCGFAGVVSQFPAKRNFLSAPDFRAQTVHAREQLKLQPGDVVLVEVRENIPLPLSERSLSEY